MSGIEGSSAGGMADWSNVARALVKNPLVEMGKPGGLLPGSEAMQSLATQLSQGLQLKLANLTGGDPLADKQTMGAAVVTQTLNTMNSDPITGAKDPNMAFQEQVLGAHAGLGGIVNKNG
ncbi:hypothetical protein SAMN02745704_00937 [Paucidesulfovibrio gracilis DSM 16080]|uniref:Uncharacterized protein n=1 Tax=Paucidesulfovibrio gracilis DSM 16080 TaxID=1121449 RepID=A0A1T4WJK9_9BACT|nr:hypothetical protein [Paucidesulfovibrio gracilis]SKA77085.1 hypothetical protein SAMN02745704_00937 [Paucidesulfovibrio gracilis DSM 16080]